MLVGDGFAVDEWPLHVTAISNFQTQARRTDLAKALQSACQTVGPVSAAVGGEEWFGQAADILVNILVDDLLVRHLHEVLLETLAHGVAFALDVPEYAGAGYRPHVTHTSLARATAGDRITFRQLALVDMAPRGEGSRREVVWTGDLVSS